MRRGSLGLWVWVSALVMPLGNVWAEDTPPPPPPAAAAGPDVEDDEQETAQPEQGAQAEQAAQPDSDGVRRDPKGVTGVSPFWESLKKGDDAFIAGDLDSAKVEYEAAIKAEPRNSLGHTRFAQVLVMQGNFELAYARLQSAFGFAKRPEERAKIVFLQADVLEREKKYEKAKSQWAKYNTLASSKVVERNPKAAEKVYPQTAKERLAQIEARKKRIAEYASVKERIEKREKELEDKARGK